LHALHGWVTLRDFAVTHATCYSFRYCSFVAVVLMMMLFPFYALLFRYVTMRYHVTHYVTVRSPLHTDLRLHHWIRLRFARISHSLFDVTVTLRCDYLFDLSCYDAVTPHHVRCVTLIDSGYGDAGDSFRCCYDTLYPLLPFTLRSGCIRYRVACTTVTLRLPPYLMPILHCTAAALPHVAPARAHAVPRCSGCLPTAALILVCVYVAFRVALGTLPGICSRCYWMESFTLFVVAFYR